MFEGVEKGCIVNEWVKTFEFGVLAKWTIFYCQGLIKRHSQITNSSFWLTLYGICTVIWWSFTWQQNFLSLQKVLSYSITKEIGTHGFGFCMSQTLKILVATKA